MSEQQPFGERQIRRGLADNTTQLDPLDLQPLDLLVAGFGEADGWRVDRHPRFVTHNPDFGPFEIVGFADDGVWVSRPRFDGFGAPEHVVAGFGFDAEAGGWQVDRHPRFMADTTGDGHADIVGFGNDGVWIARAQPNGSFTAQAVFVPGFGYAAAAGGWRVERHPRFMADTTGDGRADIVGFADDGVWVSRAQPDGSFTEPELVVSDFGFIAGGWQVERHPRFMADTTGDGRADIVGFGGAGVWVSRAQPDGSFAAPDVVVAGFGYGAAAGGWRVDRHPRFMADTTGDGRADIVGFGSRGVVVSRAQPDGSFTEPELVVNSFGLAAEAGGWQVDRHPRFMADTTGDGRADIVGFGGAGVWASQAQPDCTFTAPQFIFANFGYNAGWRVEHHPRLVASNTTFGFIGFRGAGVWVPGSR